MVSHQTFDSGIGRPLAMLALTFHAMCSDMQSISNASNEKAIAPRDWATWLEPEHTMLLGLIADAGTAMVELIHECELGDAGMTLQQIGP